MKTKNMIFAWGVVLALSASFASADVNKTTMDTSKSVVAPSETIATATIEESGTHSVLPEKNAAETFKTKTAPLTTGVDKDTRFLGLSKTKKCCNKGKKLFKKKFKKRCGFTGARFAQTHTTDEWRDLYDKGVFSAEFEKLCPKRRESDKELKKEWERAIFKFSECYASDSHKYPSC